MFAGLARESCLSVLDLVECFEGGEILDLSPTYWAIYYLITYIDKNTLSGV